MDLTAETLSYLLIAFTGILQLPLIIDSLESILPGRIGRLTHNLVSYGLVASIIGVHVFCVAVHFTWTLPYTTQRNAGYGGKICHAMFTVYLTATGLWLYTKTLITTTSGGITSLLTQQQEGTLITPPTPDQPDLFCTPCNRPRPVGGRHCRVCKQCIVLMDHHCPFTMGCVSRDNYYFFLSFLLHSALALCYVVAITAPIFLECFLSPLTVTLLSGPPKTYLGVVVAHTFHYALTLTGYEGYNQSAPPACRPLGLGIWLLFWPMLALTVCIVHLLVFQLFLLSCNMTTITFLKTLAISWRRFPQFIWECWTERLHRESKWDQLLTPYVGHRWWLLLFPWPVLLREGIHSRDGLVMAQPAHGEKEKKKTQ